MKTIKSIKFTIPYLESNVSELHILFTDGTEWIPTQDEMMKLVVNIEKIIQLKYGDNN